ncbi:hypothetical protein [Calothrix sp. PCC 7507]|uniref:hypothetical protein n=1 Tax=Calothrix sp. PCC 7507 TaxID=99598 RepID=UPI00029EEE7B|nr:hypothetical protein [Calothrix sp. PCC 7507]AFY34873.1 hypothetical protein Cal7507_4504 [Calothrix sp. PCC 7507]
MPTWNGAALPELPTPKIPNSLPSTFNWESYMSDPKGTFTRLKGARQVQRLNLKGYITNTSQVRKAVISSPSRRFVQQAGKAIRTTKAAAQTAKEVGQITKKVADEAKKTTTTLKKVQDALLKDVPGTGSDIQKAGKIGKLAKFVPGILAGLGVVLGVASLQLTKELSEQTVRQFETAGKEFDIQLRLIKKAFQSNKALDAKIQKVEKAIKINNDSNSRIAKDFFSINQNTQRANKNANDALYEARVGRQILEKKVNDNTYEIRQGRKIVEDKISKINADIAKYFTTAGNNFQQRLEATVSTIQKSLDKANKEIDKANQTISIQSKAIDNVNKVVKQLPVAITTGIKAVQDSTKKILEASVNPVIASTKKWGVTVTPATITPAIVTIADTGGVTVTPATVTPATVTYADFSSTDIARQLNADNQKRDNQISALGTGFAAVANGVNQAQNTANAALQEAKIKGTGFNPEITSLKNDINTTKTQLTRQQTDLDTLKTKVKEQEKVNEEAIPKLDLTLAKLGLIPVLVAQAIKPSIPTPEQINNAVQAGNCRSLQNGCGKKANQDLANTINANTNNATNNLGNVLGGVNASANAVQIGMLESVLARLGAQVPGGLSGFLGRFSSWSMINTAVGYLTLFATIHNGAMLSRDIGATLGQVLSNVLTLVGIKDSEGNAFDIGSVLNSSIENLIKSAIGAENYTSLSETWAKANRIYQATTNVLNSFLNLSQTILQASELIASHTGKIGNALKKGGVILENAYGWMNPQPKFNRVSQFLEGLQNGASTIQMVTQAPLDVINATTELTTASTEFLKAVKEDDKVQNKATPIPEPDELKAKESQGKTNSQPNPFDFSDLFDGED